MLITKFIWLIVIYLTPSIKEENEETYNNLESIQMVSDIMVHYKYTPSVIYKSSL